MEDAGPHGTGVIHDTQIVCHFSMARHRFQQYTAFRRHAHRLSSLLIVACASFFFETCFNCASGTLHYRSIRLVKWFVFTDPHLVSTMPRGSRIVGSTGLVKWVVFTNSQPILAMPRGSCIIEASNSSESKYMGISCESSFFSNSFNDVQISNVNLFVK